MNFNFDYNQVNFTIKPALTKSTSSELFEPNKIQNFLRGTSLALLTSATSLTVLFTEIKSNNNFDFQNIHPNQQVSFGGQSVQAEVTSNAKNQKLDIKFVKRNKDGSEVYKANGKTIIVSKKQIDLIKKELLKMNKSLDSGVTVQALPYFGTVAGMIAAIQYYVSAGSWYATLHLTRICGPNPTGCANTLIAAWQGSKFAYDQLKKWSKGER